MYPSVSSLAPQQPVKVAAVNHGEIKRSCSPSGNMFVTPAQLENCCVHGQVTWSRQLARPGGATRCEWAAMPSTLWTP